MSVFKFRSFCGFHIFEFRAIDATGTRGGLVTAWNPDLFECVNHWVGAFSLNTVLRWRVDDQVFSVSNLYGPIDRALKEGFLQELRETASGIMGVWVLLGDFNMLLSVRDKNGPLGRTAEVLSFRQTVSSLGLLDIPLSGRSFTWSNGRPNPTLERLDRVFVTRDWQLLFPRSSLRALPRPTSDHSPLLLIAFTFIPAPQLFRFEAFWLRYPEARNTISETWSLPIPGEDCALCFSSKLGLVTDNLRKWGAGLASTISKQATCCLSWTEWLDRAEEARVLLPGERALMCRLKIRFDELSLQDEIRWKQRSRVNWLKAGDVNTKFFHLKACARRNKNYISKLVVGPLVAADHHSIAHQLLLFFRSNLGSAPAAPPSFNFNLLFEDVGPDLSGLDAPFSEDEIKRAVFDLGPDKAPGPDGFPLLFFQKSWEFLRVDILEIFAKFHSGTLDLAPVNKGWICLLPKKGSPSEITDYRPISLVNGLAKIISKVLASRLQGVLGDLINPCQTAFIKGRSLIDNFLTAHFLTHYLHFSK